MIDIKLNFVPCGECFDNWSQILKEIKSILIQKYQFINNK
jgi:hypothetical protein